MQKSPPNWPGARGIGLIELMIASVLGMFIVLAILPLVIASKSMHAAQVDSMDMQETARYAFNNIARSVRQAGFSDYTGPNNLLHDPEKISAAITGLDDSTLKASSPGIESPSKSLNNASDVLAIRFFGSGSVDQVDAMLNCAGFGVAAPASSDKVDDARGWSIYYVATNGTGDPNLYCKYKKNSFTAQSIAQGVESFQVLYGVDTSKPPNGIANQFLNAAAVTALDAAIPEADLYKKTHWKKITAIQVALLIRGRQNSRVGTTSGSINLFGDGYNNSTDKGTRFTEQDFKNVEPSQVRKLYRTTIYLKNALE